MIGCDRVPHFILLEYHIIFVVVLGVFVTVNVYIENERREPSGSLRFPM